MDDIKKVVEIWAQKQLFDEFQVNLGQIVEKINQKMLKMTEFVENEAKKLDLSKNETRQFIELGDLTFKTEDFDPNLKNYNVAKINQKWLVQANYQLQVDEILFQIKEANFRLENYQTEILQILDSEILLNSAQRKNEVEKLKNWIENTISEINQLKDTKIRLQKKILT